MWVYIRVCFREGGVHDLYKISYVWYTMLAVLVNLFVTIIVSLLTGNIYERFYIAN
jgi:hypothetical protein